MSSPPTTFDPRGLLAALDRHRVAYIIVGALGRVVQGADEITRGIDIVPSIREDNLRRLDAALTELGARGPNGNQPSLADTDRKQLEPLLELTTDRGELKIIPEPTGPAPTKTSAAPPPANTSAKASAPKSPPSATSPACSPPSAANKTSRKCSTCDGSPSSRSVTASKSDRGNAGCGLGALGQD